MGNCLFCQVEEGCVADQWLNEKIFGVSIGYIGSSYKLVVSKGKSEIEFPIKYCPMCGRELKEGANG